MKLSFKSACPDCGKRSSWFSYLSTRACPKCKTTFTVTKYSLITACFGGAVIAVIPALVIIGFSHCSGDIAVIVAISIILAVIFSSLILATKLISKKTGLELSSHKEPALLEKYKELVLGTAVATGFIIFLLFIMARYFKLFFSDYMTLPYPLFTKIAIGLIPANTSSFFAVALIVPLGYFLFGIIFLAKCSKRKLFSSGIRFFETSYKLILFVTLFILSGMLMPFLPHCLSLSGHVGLNALNSANNILFILLSLVFLFFWLIPGMIKHNYCLSLLNRKLIFFASANPFLIFLFSVIELIIIRKIVILFLLKYEEIGSPVIKFIAGENLIYGILTIFVLLCVYCVSIFKISKKKKFYDRILFYLYTNGLSLLALFLLVLLLTGSLTAFITIFIRGCSYCRMMEEWGQKRFPEIIWMALGIVIFTTILIFILCKTKYRNKCKWVYFTGVLLFAVFYFPVNKKIHPPVIRMGFINKEGKIVIKPKFIHYYIPIFFRSGVCNVYISEPSFCISAGFINKKGLLAISPFEFAYPFSNGLSRVIVDDKNLKYKHGFINLNGKYLVPPRYFRAHSFSDGMALVEMDVYKNGSKDFEYGYINTKGRLVIRGLSFEAGDFSEGLAWVKVKANSRGEAIAVEPASKSAPANEESMFYDEKQIKDAFEHEMFTFIDKTGKFAILNKDKNPMLFLNAGNFSEGLARVKINTDLKRIRSDNYSMFEDSNRYSKIGFINKSGDFIIKPQFIEAKDFKEGMAAVKQNGRWGFINKKGQLIVRPKYSDVYDFSGGLARICSRNKYGFIDKSGKEVIPPVYESAGDFHEGLAAISKDGLWGYIDQTGNLIIKPQFHYARRFSEGLAAVDVKMDYY